MNSQSVVSKVVHINGKPLRLGSVSFLPRWLPLLLGLAFGPLLAFFIAIGQWPIALAIVALVPLAMLLLRYPFAGIVIWMAMIIWVPFNDTFKYLYFVAHRCLIPFVLALLLLSRMLRLKKHQPVRLGPSDIAMMAFLAMLLISIPISRKDWTAIFVLQDQFLVPFTAYWVIRLLGAQQRQLKQLIPLMLLLSLAEYAIGLMSWYVPEMIPSLWRTGLEGNRIVGTLRQPAAYGSVLLLFWVLFYHDAVTRKPGLVRKLELLSFILGMVCLFFTFTRGVWIASILVVLGLLYLYPKPTLSLTTGILLIMIPMSMGPLAAEFAHAGDRLTTAQDGAEDRLVQAHAGQEMFLARPIWGWGYGNYDLYDRRFLERVGEVTPSAWHLQKGTSHHTYLTMLAEMGALGFFLFVFPVIWWLVFTIKALPRLPRSGFWSRRLLIAMWLPILGQAVLAQDIDMRFFPYVLTLFWINLGFIANMTENACQSQQVGPAR